MDNGRFISAFGTQFEKVQKTKLSWFIFIFIIKGALSGCEFKPLAVLLSQRMFPPANLYPNDVQPLPSLHNSSCEIYLKLPKTYTITGKRCFRVPVNRTTIHQNVAISSTLIKKLESGSFSTWSDLRELQITVNSQLVEIVPGAFHSLINLWNLSISDNVKLSSLHPRSFEGLVNLAEIRLLRNNFVNVEVISTALSPSLLPNLTYLDISGNLIREVGSRDFFPMNGSILNSLYMTMTGTTFIERTSLNPLNKMELLFLGTNNINNTVATDLIKTFTGVNHNMQVLSLQSNLMYHNPQQVFKAIADSEITRLDISRNHFGPVLPGFFPPMKKLELLEFSYNKIGNFLEGLITPELMPNLKMLYLSGNSFPSITRSMVIPSLKKLDLSGNTKDLPWNTQFIISLDIFSNMTLLEELNLSENNLVVLKKGTFGNLVNLTQLFLRDTTLHEIEEHIFENNSRLFYLDLSKNDFPNIKPFTKELFKGLQRLRALDLSNCPIKNFSFPDVFDYLENLQYLSLRKTGLMEINAVFNSLNCLTQLDLSSNVITPWDQQMFKNNKNLTTLSLDRNQINTFNNIMLRDIATCENVYLYNDPVVCDCILVRAVQSYLVLEYINVRKIPFSSTVAKCFAPNEYRNKTISGYLESKVFTDVCTETSPWILVRYILTGLLIALVILFSICYQLRYEVFFWYYVVKEKLGLMNFPGMKQKTVERSGEYLYDAFVSYSHEDRKFVRKMVMILEGESRFKLCVYDRDFIAGELISDSILDSVAASRITIMVLSEAFAKSQWCQWELRIAQQRSMFFRKANLDSLIVIKLTEIDESLMTSMLKHLMKTRIYLKYDSNYKKQKLFWQQLKSTIRSKIASTTL